MTTEHEHDFEHDTAYPRQCRKCGKVLYSAWNAMSQ